MKRSLGRLLTPEVIDEGVHRHDRRCVDKQARKQSALLRAPERHRLAVSPRLERAKQAKLHALTLDRHRYN